MVDISKIDMDRIEGLIEKLNSMKYVVETWSEGTEWYRVWSDGWIEQGGYVEIAGSSQRTNPQNLIFHKPFITINYNVQFTSSVGQDGWQFSNGVMLGAQGTPQNIRSFWAHNDYIIYNPNSGSGTAAFYWYACGY